MKKKTIHFVIRLIGFVLDIGLILVTALLHFLFFIAFASSETTGRIFIGVLYLTTLPHIRTVFIKYMPSKKITQLINKET